MKALIGISLDNANYDSSRMREGLICGLRNFDEIYFLVADSLQIYNHVSKFVDSPDRISSNNWCTTPNQYVDERTSWLLKLRSRLPNWPSTQRWNVIGIDGIADNRAFKIHRSVNILFAVDPLFREDVCSWAAKFSNRSSNAATIEQRKNLSIQYILEEISLNIRVRVGYGIEEEFYLGTTFELFRNVYGRKYLKDHVQLYGPKLASSHKEIDYKFNSWSDSEKSWINEVGVVYHKNQSADVIKLVKKG